MIKLIVCGASGRMGTRILELASQNKDFQIAGAVESPSHPLIGKTILNGKVPVTANLDSLKDSADVLIDFTTPSATLTHLETIKKWHKMSAVIGTTGFLNSEITVIKETAQHLPLVVSPNMSVGVNLMFDLVRSIAKKIPNYDIEIIELHHNQKKDAPSGTALGLAKEMTEILNRDIEKDLVHGRKGEVGARTPREIGIHAIRAGDIVGDHTVIFAAPGERLEITHRASSRDAFAGGALRAAQWVHNKAPGLYSMKDVLA
jgi:4-hydroxy-tetrahydrodipicolinate reductase